MSSLRISVLAVAMILGGCSANTNSRVGEDPPIWGRVDCQRGEGNSELQKEFDDACQAIEEQKSKPTTRTKKPIKSKGNVAKSSATPERTEPTAPEKQ